MNTKRNHFARLRGILSETPTRARWDALLSLFGEWEGHADYRLGLAYAEEHLVEWPDSLRSWECVRAEQGAPTLPSFWPLVRRWSLRDVGGEAVVFDFLRQIGGERITHLDLSHNCLGVEGLACLGKLLFPRLVTLDLSHNAIGNDGLCFLCDLCSQGVMTHLNLEANELTGRGLEALWTGGEVTSLRSLFLGLNPIEDEGARSLASSPFASTLHTLFLQHANLGAGGLQALVEGDWKQLCHANFSVNRLGDQGMLVFAEHPAFFTHMRALDLTWNHISTKGIQAFARASTLVHLQQLKLAWNSLQDKGVLALSHSPNLRNLRELAIWEGELGVDGARAIAQSPYWVELRHLDLNYNALRDKGAIALAGSHTLQNLTELSLEGNGIGDDGACALVNSPSLRSLRRLNLHSNKISEKSIDTFVASEKLGRIEDFDLSANRISHGGWLRLAEAPHLHQEVRRLFRREYELNLPAKHRNVLDT